MRRSLAVGPRDLQQAFETLEEVRLELDPEASPFGRAGAIEAIRALPSFAGIPFPAAQFAPAPARSVAAPPTRTR